MSERKSLMVSLPKAEADGLEARAAMQSVPIEQYLGYHVLRSYRGALHPEVVEFDLGHIGPDRGLPE